MEIVSVYKPYLISTIVDISGRKLWAKVYKPYLISTVVDLSVALFSFLFINLI